jgi:hypothetical protein
LRKVWKVNPYAFALRIGARTMRSHIIAAVLILVPALARADEKVIGPEEARDHFNETVTLEMVVKSSMEMTSGVVLLNSEKDRRNVMNLSLFIKKDTVALFKKAKIVDPAAHYKDKTVRVTGKLITYLRRPAIELKGPDDIRIVETRKTEKKGG